MKKIVSLAAGMLVVVSTSAQAQVCNAVSPFPSSCTVVHTVSATAPAILTLTLSSTTTSLTNPVEADFDAPAGVSDIDALNVEVKSNKNASVTIHTAAANWSGPGATTKSIADLGWSITSGGPYAAMTGTGVTMIASGKGLRDEDISWNTQWAILTDEPGAYSLPVTFTLVVP